MGGRPQGISAVRLKEILDLRNREIRKDNKSVGSGQRSEWGSWTCNGSISPPLAMFQLVVQLEVNYWPFRPLDGRIWGLYWAPDSRIYSPTVHSILQEWKPDLKKDKTRAVPHEKFLNYHQSEYCPDEKGRKSFVISLLFPATGCPLSGWVTLPSFLLQHQLIRLSQQSGPFLPATILAVDIWNNPKSWPCSKPVRVSETCAVLKLLGTDTRESWLEADIRTGLTSCQPSENVAPLLSNCKGWGCQNSVPQENFFFTKHLITLFLVNGSLESDVLRVSLGTSASGLLDI